MSLIDFKNHDQSGKDFSGLDISNKIFENIDFHDSVFNGAHFKNVQFLNCDLKHTEFTEVKFTNCRFVESSLNYSDFIYAQTENVDFERCSFLHVEWRDNKFEKLKFHNCKFDNATIALCTFKAALFDEKSANSFCGPTKRYNVFGNTNFHLENENIEFLQTNYGISLNDKDAQLVLEKKNSQDYFLLLSGLNYTNQLNSWKFIDLVLKTMKSLIKTNQKSRIQKVKYLSLICKLTIDENKISVFGLQLLINSLNSLSSELRDSFVFMELVDLIVFIKTEQQKNINTISSEMTEIDDQFSNRTILQFKLENTYEKKQVRNYLNIMSDFLGIPSENFRIINYQKGSTIVDIAIDMGMKISSILLFISFSLSKVNKVISYLVEIKKNTKKLLENPTPTKKPKKKSDQLMPLAIMSNEGNIYYVQINNIVNNFGKEIINIDGSGTVNVVIDNSIKNV